MPTFLSELLAQIRGIWSRLDGGQRLTIMSVGFATLVGLGAIVWFAGRPDYESVFVAEDPTSLDEAVRALGSAGVSFKEDGNRLLVERSVTGRAMQALFRAGVTGTEDPERDVGPAGVTMDSMSRRDALMVKRNRRARKAVMQIDGVIDAYVTSTVPKRSVFASRDEETKPRAAVTLTIRPGESFTAVARAAIEQVAASVGVPEGNVTAVDARTKQTFTLGENGTDIAGTEFLDQQRRRGDDLTRMAQHWLDRLYDGRALVTVTVDLDPEFTSSEEKIQPSTPAIVTDDLTKDSTTGMRAGAAGDPSANAIDSAELAAVPASTQKSETRKRTYEPFVGVRRTGMLSPDIRRMTVALVLDESIDTAKHASIESAIKSTVGFMDDRPSGMADRFTMLVEKFPELPEVDAVVGVDVFELAREFGPLAGQILGVALVLLFLRRLLRTAAPKRGSAESQGPVAVAMKATEEDESLAPDERRRRLRRDIERSIAEDPAAMSRLLEGWLAEQRV